MVASVIIGIHGLANKPPADEKKEWWKSALIEGLNAIAVRPPTNSPSISSIGQI
jgi:hypothetical protein